MGKFSSNSRARDRVTAHYFRPATSTDSHTIIPRIIGKKRLYRGRVRVTADSVLPTCCYIINRGGRARIIYHHIGAAFFPPRAAARAQKAQLALSRVQRARNLSAVGVSTYFRARLAAAFYWHSSQRSEFDFHLGEPVTSGSKREREGTSG